MLPSVDQLVQVLARLPGLGRRSAARVALSLLKEPGRLLDPLVDTLQHARANVICCSRCGSFTEVGRDPCALCRATGRDSTIVCVVEEPADVVLLEQSGAFRGRYHVLGGKLAPVRHVGPDQLRVDVLKQRIVDEGIREVLLALSTDMEGDATAGFVAEMLQAWPNATQPVKVTRLAFGLPADSGVAYSDPLTLRRAIVARCEV